MFFFKSLETNGVIQEEEETEGLQETDFIILNEGEEEIKKKLTIPFIENKGIGKFVYRTNQNRAFLEYEIAAGIDEEIDYLLVANVKKSGNGSSIDGGFKEYLDERFPTNLFGSDDAELVNDDYFFSIQFFITSGEEIYNGEFYGIYEPEKNIDGVNRKGFIILA